MAQSCSLVQGPLTRQTEVPPLPAQPLSMYKPDVQAWVQHEGAWNSSDAALAAIGHTSETQSKT